jgi:TolB-like protein/Flp pilus assembly protein TadD
VLPFANLSSDQDNAYFSDGIQHEILTRLARISALKVISQTSTRQYVSAPENLSEIGRQLGVANIVEGSVQRVGDSVRINVQLIQASTDTHLWAEIYDRKLVDVFSIQSEVAAAIAAALQATLTQDEQRAVDLKPTANTGAYDAYLRGLSAEPGEFSADAMLRAHGHYLEAVRLDPDFVEAWTRLIKVQSVLYFSNIVRAPAALEGMRLAVETVARLRPGSGEAWLALGNYQFRGLRDYPAALEAFERALVQLPNDAESLGALAFLERRLGRQPQALVHVEHAERLDPRNPQWPVLKGRLYAEMRRYPEARTAYDRSLELIPGNTDVVISKVGTFRLEGDLESAQELLATLPPPEAGDELVRDAHLAQHWFRRRHDLALALCTAALTRAEADLAADPGIKPDILMTMGLYSCIGDARRLLGDTAAAQAAYRRLLELAKQGAATIDAHTLALFLAQAYSGLGDKASALREGERAVTLTQGDATNLGNAKLELARIHARFGDAGAAIAILEPLLEGRYRVTPALLRLDPSWDPIRKDPRFRKLSGEAEAATGPK